MPEPEFQRSARTETGSRDPSCAPVRAVERQRSLGSRQSRGDRKWLFCRWLVRVLSDPPPFFPIAGIPTLIVLDPKGEVITRQGRVEVLNDVECREFPWHPKPVLELTDSNAVQLNEGPCLVLFVGTERPGGARLSHGRVCWRTPRPQACQDGGGPGLGQRSVPLPRTPFVSSTPSSAALITQLSLFPFFPFRFPFDPDYLFSRAQQGT